MVRMRFTGSIPVVGSREISLILIGYEEVTHIFGKEADIGDGFVTSKGVGNVQEEV